MELTNEEKDINTFDDDQFNCVIYLHISLELSKEITEHANQIMK